MFVRLLLILAVLALVFFLMSKYRRLPKEKQRQWLIKVAVGALVAALLLGVVTGRMHWLGAVLAALIGFARFGLRFWSGLSPLLGLMGGTPFGNPVFSTPFLKVQLNLQNKTLSGDIVDGPYKGNRLENLTDTQLAELETFYQERDKRSYFLIRVIRQGMNQNTHGEGNRQSYQHSNYTSAGDPSYDEALQILGLDAFIGKPPPEKTLVVKAHRKLMQKLHPDHGGNDYLASRVNLAKEVVIKRITA